MSAFALSPRWNVRLFSAGAAASLAAASRWCPGFRARDAGAWTLLVEGLTAAESAALSEAAVESGAACTGFEGAAALSGSAGALDAAARRLQVTSAPLADELLAALDAFSSGLESPPRPLVMGILNVTPDSFSDGGLWLDTDAAVDRALRMLEEGADVIDIGGESTRPGAEEVPAEEELRRVVPVVERLRAESSAVLSVDTRKAAVAEACLAAGADWVNDVSGLTFDPAMGPVVARYPEAHLVLMHSRVRPAEDRFSTGYDAGSRPEYNDLVADTLRWLRRQAGAAVDQGVRADRIWIDPGFGFGKTPEQNVDLLRRLREYAACGLPVLVGTSRKSTVGKLLGDLPPDQRMEGTAATVAASVLNGAAAVRVHDVREMARVARVAAALR